MASTAFVLDVHFERVNCCECGVPFAAPTAFFTRRRESHAWFYCPNGHSQHYPAQTEAEQLRAQLADEQERHKRSLSRLNLAETRARKAERKVKRTARGVCSCCNRTFANLAAHMKTKHPVEVPSGRPGKLPA